MSNTDKTIEELEAEVMAELEEANGQDAPTKGAVPAEPMKKKKNGEMQDTGAAVVSPMQGDAPAKKVAAAAKEISGDPAQKKEGKPDQMDKAKEAGKNKPLAASYHEGFSDEEINSIHGPIGIKLGGKSAPEIALSIIAQLVAETYKK